MLSWIARAAAIIFPMGWYRDGAVWYEEGDDPLMLDEEAAPGLVRRLIQDGVLRKDDGQDPLSFEQAVTAYLMSPRRPIGPPARGLHPTPSSRRTVAFNVETAGCWRQPWRGGQGPRERSLSAMARRFFPTVPADKAEVFAYPRPLSEPFWVLYSEPLQDFFAAASVLRGTLLDLALVGQATKKTAREPDDAPPLDHVLLTLERLVGPVTPTIIDDGGLRQRWVFSSLISSFAMMVLQDLLAGHRPLVCKRCQTVFLSRAYQAKYCGPRCQNAAQVERHGNVRRKPCGSPVT